METMAVLLLAAGLAMDAFAVSICKGLAMRKPSFGSMLTVGIWFGLFQGLMPVIGFALGAAVYDRIENIDHWIAFGLLALIGVNMIRESLSGGDEQMDADISFRTMIVLAVATSIDALAVGVSLAMEGSDIYSSALVIGIVTLVLSMIGVKAGSLFGERCGRRAELAGGLVLVALGFKILLEHTGFL